jgi:hypothetical protein
MGEFHCLNCYLAEEEDDAVWQCKTRKELYAHLLDHRDQGHKVPADAIRRVIAEMAGIPWVSQQHEFEDLMAKLAAPNSTMNEFMQTVRTANSKRLAALMDEFVDVLCDLDNLDWPDDDDY